MNRHIMLVGRAAGRGAFKGAALVGAFAIIVAAWWWDASLLTAAADTNLQLIKIVTSKLPFDWGSKVEKRAADLRRRSRPPAHRGRRHRQSHHAQHRLPISPSPAVRGKRPRPAEPPFSHRTCARPKLLPRLSRDGGFNYVLVSGLLSPAGHAKSDLCPIRSYKTERDQPKRGVIIGEMASRGGRVPVRSYERAGADGSRREIVPAALERLSDLDRPDDLAR